MNLYTERKALEDHIKWIKEERRKLAEEYWKSVERLRELDSQLSNEGQNELVEKLMTMIELQSETIGLMKDKIPHVPIETVVEQWKQENKEKVETKKLIPESEIAEAKYRENKKRIGKRLDYTVVAKEIEHFIKETGRPVQTKEITIYLNEKGIKLSNPTSTLNRVMELNEKIERVYKGYYQLT